MLSRKRAHFIIHTATAIHGVTAALLSQVPFADSAALTAETVAMVTLIAKKCGAGWSKATIEAFAAQKAAEYVGVEIAKHGYKYIPLWGNLANAGVSMTLTEILGWITYDTCLTENNAKQAA